MPVIYISNPKAQEGKNRLAVLDMLFQFDSKYKKTQSNEPKKRTWQYFAK